MLKEQRHLHFEEHTLRCFVNQSVRRVHTMFKSVEDSSQTLNLSFVVMEHCQTALRQVMRLRW